MQYLQMLKLVYLSPPIAPDVEPGDNVEWIPTLFGKEINEWAVWTEALNQHIVGYWDFNEASGDLIDKLNGTHNGTVDTGVVYQDPGIINGSYTFTSGGNDYVNITDGNIGACSDNNCSISLWVNVTGAFDRVIYWEGPKSGSLSDNIIIQDAAGSVIARRNDALVNIITAASGFTKDEFVHIVAVFNTTDQLLYMNGTFEGFTSLSGTFNNGQGNSMFACRTQSFVECMSGSIDEVGMWNRSLTASEVTDLYNDGDGLGFNADAIDIDFDVALVSPSTSFSTVSTSLNLTGNFSISPTTGIFNITNSTLFVWYSNDSLFNETTTPDLSGTFNETTINLFNIPLGTNFNWNYESCAINTTGTICSRATANNTFSRNSFSEDNFTFNAIVNETANEEFELNITTIPGILSVTATLNYNGTRTLGSATCVGNLCSIRENIDIPLVASGVEQNKTFLWEISVFDGSTSTSFNSSLKEQNVTKIFLEQCNATFIEESLNFTVFDEQNLSRISPFRFDATFDFWVGGGTVKRNNTFSSNVTEMDLCISPNITMQTDATIDYDESENTSLYTPRFYYFDKFSIDDNLQDINMFLLKSTSSTSFILKVQDENLLPVRDALIEIHRFYPGEGIFKIIQIARTDDNGKSIGFFETETVDYKFIIKKGGVTLLETGQQKVIPETSPFTLTFNTGEDLGEPWSSQNDIVSLNSTLTWNKNTGIVTYTYVDTSGNFTLGRLLVQQTSLTNSSAYVTICNDNSSLSSATLNCNVGNTTGFYVASSFITRTGEGLDKQISFQIEYFSTAVGILGLFFGWFLILIASFMFKFNEVAGIWSMTITIFLVNLMGLISFGSVFVTAIIAIAIVLTWVMEK